jgi:predicted DNA binding CopG/RHH family protein
MDLDQEELELLESFERGEWQSIPDKAPEIKRHQAYAKATFEQEKHLDVYLSVRDFNRLSA